MFLYRLKFYKRGENFGNYASVLGVFLFFSALVTEDTDDENHGVTSRD